MSLNQNSANITKYCSNKSCLIVEESASARMMIKKILTTFGMPHSNITVVRNAEEAMQQMATSAPNILLVSYELGRDSCIKLQNEHIKLKPNRIENLYIITSGNNSLAFVSMMLDLEVDMYFCKPYTVQTIESGLGKAFASKVNLSSDAIFAETLRALYLSNQHEKLIEIFEKNRESALKNATSAYYVGSALLAQNNIEQAEFCFQKGIERQPNHFKCLTSICDFYVSQKQHDKAYKYFEKLLKQYTLNSRQICNLIRVFIFNKMFDDLVALTEMFLRLTDICGHTKMNIAAGLAISSRYLIKQNKKAEAVKTLNHAASFSMGKKEIIREIVGQLLSIEEVKAADNVLNNFYPLDENSVESKLMNFEINSKIWPPGKTVKVAQDLLKSNIKDKIIYDTLLKNYQKLGMKKESIDDLIFEASRVLPEHADYFKKNYLK